MASAAPIPTTTIVGLSPETMLGESVSFQVSFDNTSATDTGYGPFIDLVFPFNGADGAAGTDTPDGIDFLSASYLGGSVETTILSFPDDGGGVGCVDHPLLVDTNHVPYQVCGTTGDKLVVLRLPFGSVVPDQPVISVDISADLSDLADLGSPLAIHARGGFEYGADPLDNPCCDPVIANPADTDSSNWPSASTTSALIRISKTYISADTLGEEGEITVGPAYPHQYRVTVDIADGQTITNLDLSDLLPNNMQFLSVDQTLLHGSAVGATAISTPSTSTPGGILTRRFASVTGDSSAADAEMIFSFYIPRLDAGGSEVIPAGSCTPATSENNATALGDWNPVDARDTGGTDNASADPAGPEHTLSVKTIPLQKSVGIASDTGVAGASPGDTLEYTLEFQVSDVMAFNALHLKDIISDGQRFDTGFTPTIEVHEHGTTTGPAAFNGASFSVTDHYTGAASPVAPIDGTQEIDFEVSDEMVHQGLDAVMLGSCVPPGGTGGPAPDCSSFASGESKVIVRFRSVIQEDFSDDYPSTDSSVDQGDELRDDVSVDGALLDPSDLSSAGPSCDDDSQASVQIARGALTKELYAINGSTTLPSPLEIFPGDTVSYRISYSLTTSDFENLSITDFLPLPVFLSTEVTAFNSTVDASVPSAGTAKYGPLDTFHAYSGLDPTLSSDAAANTLIFSYGDFDSVSNTPTVIDLLFTVTVTDEPFADGLFLTNQARVHEGSTNSGDTDADAIVQITLREPYLSVRKGVCGTDNPDESFNPPLSGNACPGQNTSNDLDSDPDLADSNASGVDVGDLMSFVISIENQGGSGAFDISIHDVMPPGFCLPGCLVADPMCAAGAAGLNLSVVRGDGFTPTWVARGTYNDDRDLFSNGLMLDDSGGQPLCQPHDPVAGSNTLTITYDLEICDPTLVPGSLLSNQGGVNNYAGDEGGPSHVDPGNPSDFTDPADTTLASPQLVKSLVGTSVNDGFNAAGEAVIGETATYRLILTVPEVQMPSAHIVDTLDSGLAFVAVDSVSYNSGDLTSTNTIGTGPNPSNVTVGANGSSLDFDFGTITNANRDNTVDETITIVYRAVVLDVIGNQAGTTLGNSATLTWSTGALGPVSAPDLTLIEPAIAIDKNASPTNADAGDTISYTINVTSPNNPQAANAMDVLVSDTIPVGMSYVAGSLGTGTCATAPTTLNDSGAPVLNVTWSSFPPGGSCQITYQATVDPTVAPGQVIPNTAASDWSSLSGSPGQISTHNTDSTERDGSGGVNDYAGSDGAQVTIHNVVPVKTIAASSEAFTSATDVAVGEIVRYRLVTTLPESTVPNLQLRDLLPSGLQFINDGTAMLALVSNQNPIQSTEPATSTLGLALGAGVFGTAPWVNGNDPTTVTPTYVLPDANVGSSNSLTANADSYGSGTDVYFKLGDLLNPDSDADSEYIVLEFNVLVLNNSAIYDGRTRDNSFSVDSGGTQLAQSPNVTVIAREPAVTDFTKTVNPTSGDAGDVVTYTIGWSNSGHETAWDTHLDDVISAGLSLNVASVNVTLAGGASGVTDNTAGNTVSILISEIPVGGSVTVTYTATIQTSVTPDQVLSNNAAITYTSLPGTNGTTGAGNPTGSDNTGAPGSTTGERDGSGTGENDYLASDTADVTIGSPQLAKIVASTSETSTGNGEHTIGIEDLTIGETATFNITTTLPEGTTSQVVITDSLPANATGVMEYVSASVVALGGNLTPTTANPVPSVSDANLSDGINDTVSMDFGQVVNTPDDLTDANDQITIAVVARLKNVAANADGNLLTNSALLQYGSGLQASDTAQVEVVEPALSVSKTASPTTGDAGDTITFTVSVSELSAATAEAFDLLVSDVIPADMSYAGNVQTTAGSAPTVDATNDPTITFSWDSMALGAGPYTFSFDVTLDSSVHPQQLITNTANLAYDTLPADDDAEERDHTDSDQAQVTITQPGLTKVVASTTVAETGNGTDTEPDLTIGEQVSYTVTVNIPEGTTSNALVIDDLPTAPGLLEVVSSQITAMDASMVASSGQAVGSVGTASDENTDGRNDRVSFDFGTLTNPPGDTNTITIEVVAVVPDLPVNQGGLDGLVNTASFSFGGGNPLQATAAVDIVAPDLTVNKTLSNPASPFGDAGDTLTYRLTVAHGPSSSAEAFDVVVSDSLPAGQSYVPASLNIISGPAPTEDLSALPGTVFFSWSSIALADSPVVFEYQVTLDADVHPAQTYTNTANLSWDSLPTGAPGDGGANDRSGSDSDSADVTINAPALVKVTGVTSLSDTGQSQHNGTLEDLAIGESVSYEVTITLPEGVTQSALITDSLQADANGVLEAIGASVQTIGANITTTQPGTPSYSDLALADGLNDTVTFDFGSITNAADGVITDADRIVVEVTARVVDVAANADADDLLNFASLSYATGPAVSDTADVEVVEPLMGITKTLGAPVNGVVPMSITLSNSGTAPAYDINISDVMPSAMWDTSSIAPVSIPSGFTFAAVGAPGDATITIASDSGSSPPASSIEVGEAVIFSFQAAIAGDEANPAVNPLVNTAINDQATSLPGPDSGEREEPDVQDQAQLNLPSIELDKSWAIAPGGDLDASGTPSPGDILRYSITVTNGGLAAATNLVISDPISDPNLSLVVGSVTAGAGAVITTGNGGGDTTIRVDYASFAGGGNSDTISYDVQVANPVAAGVSTLTNWASGDCDELPSEPSDDPTTGPDDDPTVVPLDAAPDIAVTKDDGITEVRPGGALSYTITVSNLGNQGATGVVLSDPIPAGTSFVSASDGGAESGGTVTWPAFSLAAGASVTRTLNIQVNDPAPVGQATVDNTATAADDGTNGTDSDPTNNTDTDSDTLIQSDLAIVKSDSPDPVRAGETLTYTLAVTNNGPSADTNVTVTDTLPVAFSYQSAVPSQGSCSQAAGVVSCNLGPMASGGTATITVVCDIPSDTAEGSYTNTAVVTGDESDPDLSNNTDDEDTTVAREIDLGITKSDSPDPVVAGENLTWTLDVVNNGPSDATGVTVTDTLPAGVSFLSASPGCSEIGGTVSCAVGDLASGDTTQLQIVVTVDASTTGTISNTASVTGDQTDTVSTNDSDDEDTVVETEGDIALVKDGPATVSRGANLIYSILVTNNGPSDALNLSLSDPTPGGLSFVSADAPCAGGFPCALGNLAAGASISLTATYTVPVDYSGADPILNTASVSSDTVDTNPDNNSDDATTAVDRVPECDITVVKTGPPSAALGSTVSYSLVVSNNGPDSAENVSLNDPTPSGLIFDSAETPCAAGFPCALGDMAPGDSMTIHVTFQVPAAFADTQITNTATVSTDTEEIDLSNNDDEEITPIGAETTDLTVNKEGPTAANPGDDIVYTITVTNLGPGDATGVTATDAFPGDVTWVSDTCGNDFGDGIWNIGNLAAGASITCAITAHVAPAAAGPQTNSVVVAGNEPESDNTNNDDEVITGIGAEAADVAVIKSGPARSFPGSDLSYTFTVNNNGPGAATNVQLADPTPTGLSFVSASAPCAGGFPCTLGDLQPGSSLTLSASFAVPTNYSGPDPIVNTATVSTDSIDTDSTNDEDDALTDYVPEADLAITKDDGLTTVVPGTALVYSILVSNNGPGDVVGATVTDNFPAILTGISWSCTASAGSSCSASGVGNIADTVNLLPGGSLSYTVNATVVAGATGSLVNTATVDLPTGMTDPDLSDNTDDDVDILQPETDLSIVKSDSADPVMEGDQFTYILDLVNNGPSDATNVVISDPLPSGVSYVSSTTTQGSCAESGGTLSCSLGNMAVGATAQVQILVSLNWGEAGPLSNTATVDGDEVDPTPDDNTDTEDTDTLYTDLDALKTVSDPADGVMYRPGEIVTWSIDVTNSGNTAATSAELVDEIPFGATYIAGSMMLDGVSLSDALDVDAGAFDPSLPGISVDLASIPAGGTRTVSFETSVQPGTGNPAASVTNQATIVTPGGDIPSDDPTTGDDDDPTVIWVKSFSIPVAGPFGLSLLIFLISILGVAILRRMR